MLKNVGYLYIQRLYYQLEIDKFFNNITKDKKPVFVFLANNAIRLPMPVDSPANNVNPKAVKIKSVCIYIPPE
jgi:TPP-dependent 2-oxoacid decarboxylase